MNNEIMTFTNTEFGELEVWQDGDRFWFPATRCAEILEYSNPRDAILRHCKAGGVVKHDAPYEVSNQFGFKTEGIKTINYISEGNLYRLIARSKMPGAERFESWVFDEVLPSIRKHGAYIMPELLEELQRNTEKNAILLSQLAKEQRDRATLQAKNNELTKLAGILKTRTLQLEAQKADAEKKAETLESTVKENEPKVSYYDIILQNPKAVPVTLIAKDYGYTAVMFNKLLHAFRIQYPVGRTWALYCDYADNGYTHTNVFKPKNGKEVISHTCWTQKGRKFLYDFLKAEGIIPMIER